MKDRCTAPAASSGRMRVARLGRRATALLVPLALASTAATAPALAADAPTAYSEVHRFGSFDSAYWNNGAYDGSGGPAAGAFVMPTAFAVDTNAADAPDGQAIYVLDRTSAEPSTLGSARSQWRLQKLSDTGAVLGVATFSLPGNVTQKLHGPIDAIAVDHDPAQADGRVYLLVRSSDQTAPQEVIAFSTAASGGKLESPSGLTTDDAWTQPTGGSNAARVLSTQTQLTSTGAIGTPAGLALAGSGAQRTLAVLSTATDGSVAVTRLALQDNGGIHAGDTLNTWSSGSLASDPLAPPTIAPAGSDQNGLSTNPDGSLTVLLSNDVGNVGLRAADVDVVTLGDDLASAKILESSANSTLRVGAGRTAASSLALWAAISVPSPAGSANPGPEVVALPGGRYAALYAAGAGVTSWATGLADGSGGTVSNLGIRLLGPVASPGDAWNGTLSNPDAPTRSILNTLGSGTATGACAIAIATPNTVGDLGVGLAAGKDGAVWVLKGGREPDTFGQTATELNSTRQLVQLAPGTTTGQPCSQPSGTFGAKVGATALDPSQPLTVRAGTTIDFDGSAVDYKGAWVSSYQWDVDGLASNGYELSSTLDRTALATRPVSTASQQYTVPGQYTLRLRMFGDFGELDRTTTLTVQATTPPLAAFTASASSIGVGQSVSFDGSGSAPPQGTRIVNYHWDYGDGVVEDSQTPQLDHVFGAPGTYTVKLSVRGSDNQVSSVATHDVTVNAPTITTPTTPTTTPTTPTTTPTTPITTPTTPRVVTPKDTTPPDVTPKASGAKGVVALSISCPAAESACVGTAKLTVKTKVKTGKGKKARTTTKIVTVGQASFSLRAGQKRSLTIALNATGRALLRKSKTLKLSLAIVAHDLAGNTKTTSLSVTVKQVTKPAKKARRR